MTTTPFTFQSLISMPVNEKYPDLLSVAEVAKRLRCSRALVYQLCEHGKLSHHRLGIGRGTIRIMETDIEVFLEQSRVAAPPPQLRKPLKHIRLSPK